MKMRSKLHTFAASTMTYMVSIWIGLILVGSLMYPEHFVDVMKQLTSLYSDPFGTLINMLVNALNGPAALYIATVAGISVIGGGLSTIFGGGGFSLLFIIPLVLIASVMTLFALPVTEIMNMGMPPEIQVIFSVFMGALMMVTIYSFTSGRS